MKNTTTIILFLLLALSSVAQTKSEFFLVQGKEAMAAGEHEKALAYLTEAIKSDKKNAEAYYCRGLIYCEGTIGTEEQTDLAIKDFKTVLKLAPNHFSSLVFLGVNYAVKKDLKTAISYFERAEKIDSLNYILYIRKGTAYSINDKNDKAMECFNRAVRLAPNEIVPYHFRSSHNLFLGKNEEALRDLETVARLDSSNHLTRLNLAFSYLSLGYLEKADSLYTILKKEGNNLWMVYNNFGYLRFKQGKAQEALEYIKKGLDLKPDNSYAYKYLAEIYLAEGDKQAACEAATKGLALGYTKQYGNDLQEFLHTNCK